MYLHSNDCIIFYRIAQVIRHRLADFAYGWYTEYGSPRWKLAGAYQDAFKWWLRDVNFYNTRDPNNGRNSLQNMPAYCASPDADTPARPGQDIDYREWEFNEGMLSYWDYEPEEQSRDVRDDYLQDVGERMGKLVQLAKDIQEDASLLEVVPGDFFIVEQVLSSPPSELPRISMGRRIGIGMSYQLSSNDAATLLVQGKTTIWY
ncbi:hypothetical protein BDV19DRAFT_383832 [Aspergillus venezuelensis]